MADSQDVQLEAKILTVSDRISAGRGTDTSGPAINEILKAEGYLVTEQRVCPDGAEQVANALSHMAYGFNGLIVSTGGTGFGPRDKTPEGTRRVLDRLAPGLSEAARAANPLGRLSRGVAGTRGLSIIVNVAGNESAATEMLNSVIDVIPHALQLLAGTPSKHPTPHGHIH